MIEERERKKGTPNETSDYVIFRLCSGGCGRGLLGLRIDWPGLCVFVYGFNNETLAQVKVCVREI